MARLNCFIDETGQDDMSSDVYLITLVFHDHSTSLDGPLAEYATRLGMRSLPDIPFHMVDLIHGSTVVSKAVRAAFDFVLARNVASYRKPVYSERRLMPRLCSTIETMALSDRFV